MKTRIHSILLSLLACSVFCVLPVSGQDADAVKNVPVNTPGDITGSDRAGDINTDTGPETVVPAIKKETLNPPHANRVKKENPQLSAPLANTADRNPEDKGVNPDLLLPIEDGNYKYSRIPGIQLKETKGASSDDIVRLSEKSGGDSSGAGKSGLFGMSKSSQDTLVKISILLLIVVIFILYRIRSGRSSRRVFKSFRK
jgi:hypothetical protein